MFGSLIRRIFPSKGKRKLEEHYRRQEKAAEAEIEATGESMATALMTALSPCDPGGHKRYQRYRQQHGRAVAETAAYRDAQQSMLANAFSLLDSAHTQRLNDRRRKHGLQPL